LDKLEFVTGSSYQYTPDYTRDLFRLSSITSEHDSKKAGAEVVKQTASPPLSGLLYPLLQALDEEYLGVDIQFGGVDQRKIFILAEMSLPKLGMKKRAHLMNGMVPGLAGGKMSSSDPDSKIDFLDPPAVVKKKIKAAVAAPGVVEDNGLLAFIKAVLLPIATLQLSSGKEKSPFAAQDVPDLPKDTLVSFVRKEEHGGTVHFSDYESIEAAYAKEEIHPGDLKAFVTESINSLLAPIQEEFKNNPQFQEADKLAYPPPPVPEKKVKASKKHNKIPEGVQVGGAPNAKKDVEKAVKNQTEEQKQGKGNAVDMATVKDALPEA
jgi:tyrosyl-tRNA synthetase